VPVNTMEIAADWTAWPKPVVNNIVFGNSKDSGGQLIILKFRYSNVKMHVTMPLGEGGDTNSFHITADDKSDYVTGFSGGHKCVKGTQSTYFNFVIRNGPGVEFTPTDKIKIEGQDKLVKVTSASFQSFAITAVKDFMRQFLVYMVNLGHGRVG